MPDRAHYAGIGCGDGNCDFRRPTGMHTNAGCRCFPRHADEYDQAERSRLRRWVRVMRDRIAEAEAEKAHMVRLNRELRDRPDLGDRAKSVEALRKALGECEAELSVMHQDRNEWQADAERNRAAYAESMIRASKLTTALQAAAKLIEAYEAGAWAIQLIEPRGAYHDALRGLDV